MPKPLVRPRTHAFAHQSGRCFYCDLPMWADNPLEFATEHGLTPKQARHLQCTGEHLVARQDGGSSARTNIVAACKFCNQGRHNRKTPPPPDRYLQMVRKRMRLGRWHGQWAFQKGLERPRVRAVARCGFKNGAGTRIDVQAGASLMRLQP